MSQAGAPAPSQSTQADADRPWRLRCDARSNPLATSNPKPTLSWKPPASRLAGTPEAYRILVATSEAALGEGGDVWDSGWVVSKEVSCRYSGRPAVSRERLWWQVKARFDNAATSDWSRPAWWEAGLLERSQWSASWIRRAQRGRVLPDRAVSLFRKRFNLTSQPARARLYVTALGIYEVYINGLRMSDGLFRPGWTDYTRRLQYQALDVKTALRAGQNVVGVVLAPGWFAGKISSRAAVEDASHPDVRCPELLLQLETGDSPVGSVLVRSDESWEWAASPIVSSDLYDGEDWDLRLSTQNWSDGQQPATTGSWRPVETSTGTTGELVTERSAPVRITGIRDVAVSFRPDGVALIDSGINDSGFLRLTVREDPGRHLEVRYGEILDPTGNLYRDNLQDARCIDNFICSGAQDELAPAFSYRGYRYAEVRGLSQRDNLLRAQAVTIGSDLERVGWFRSSEPVLQAIYELALCSLRSNYVEVPTDCPQRSERLGWMGDAHLFAPLAAYSYDISAFMSKWFDDVLDARGPAGGFSDVAPRPSAIDWWPGCADGAPGWADAGVLLPLFIYEHYGDREVIERMFPAMLTWLQWLHEVNPDGIWRVGRGLDHGDWLPAGPGTGHELLATCWLYRSTRAAQQVAEILGDEQSAKWLDERSTLVREAFQARFVDPRTGRVADPNPRGSANATRRSMPVFAPETQTGYVVALSFGLLQGQLATLAATRLRTMMLACGGRLQTGIVGSAYLLHVLEKAGFAGLAYEQLLSAEYPSLGFMAAHGATSIWERWNGLGPDGWPFCPAMNSFNHFALGSMLSWLIEGVCGLRALAGEPCFRELRFAPAVSRRVSDASFLFDSPSGRVRVGWQWRGESEVVGDLEVPNGVSCSIARAIAIDDQVTGAVLIDEESPSCPTGDRVARPGQHTVIWRCAR